MTEGAPETHGIVEEGRQSVEQVADHIHRFNASSSEDQVEPARGAQVSMPRS